MAPLTNGNGAVNTSSLLRAALALAARGLAVFPLKPRDKAPSTKHGFKDATTDPVIIRAWWEGWPDQNIGIATGERSGVWVLDVDGEAGEATLRSLIERHGDLPPTVELITGKGRHLYFRWVDGIGSTAKRLGPGLDTRGDDGYVVAPPSIHPSGKRYHWSVDSAAEFADAPEWLVEKARDSRPKTNGHADDSDRAHVLASLPSRLVAIIETEAGQGERSDHCYHVMQCLFEHGLSNLDVRAIADGAPFARKFWDRGDLIDEIHRARDKWERAGGKRHGKPPPPAIHWLALSFTGEQLEQREFPPVSWVVPALIPEGVSLLAGRPKIGKSWLALDLALGVAGGASHVMTGITPERGDVLYCALEDNPRRLQKRIRKLLGVTGQGWPSRLRLATAWRRLDQGGVEDIAEWASSVAAPKLVILDTLAACRPLRTNNGYAEDYEALASVHRLANELGIGLLALHHVRKMEAEDPIDQVSGTLGLSGAADTVMVLNRSSQGTTLYGRGRDLEEFDRAVEFSKETCKWRLLGNTEEVRRSDTRKAILEALNTIKSDDDWLGPQDIADLAGLEPEVVRQRLGAMVRAGEVVTLGRGKYRLPRGPVTTVTSSQAPETPEKSNG